MNTEVFTSISLAESTPMGQLTNNSASKLLLELFEQLNLGLKFSNGQLYWWYERELLWTEYTKPQLTNAVMRLLVDYYTAHYNDFMSNVDQNMTELQRKSVNAESKKLQEYVATVGGARFVTDTVNILMGDPKVTDDPGDKPFYDRLNSNKIIDENGALWFMLPIKGGELVLVNGTGWTHRKRVRTDYMSHFANIDLPDDDFDRCTELREFTSQWMCKNEAMTDFLLALGGMALFGYRDEQRFWIIVGKGAGGKSAYIELLEKMLSNRFCAKGNKDLIIRKSKDAHTESLNKLMGKRAVVWSESSQQVSLNESFVKEMTGDPTMAVRGLYEKEVDRKVTFLPILATNFVPNVTFDDAIWRRLVVVRFDAKFYEESAYNDVLKNIEDEEQNPPPPSATDDDDKPKLIIKPRDRTFKRDKNFGDKIHGETRPYVQTR
ncbi:hypothetical protein CAOG_009280 [Capsaspora owczarzaki ATCC 30864]|uniref:SF3 helicase domain-containing protein n=1 Tax=Capsaspora owczarzaki (strain ATCC 30864) TaxID=595528 RepID=A0A0D2WGE5_CAPO3|nr:hypothetical protein CAOG_009280 [Capsaspora owczarzaki ATCC 30864]